MIRQIILSAILFSAICKAQYTEKDLSISINANYTTTAKIYLNPNSQDIDLKNRSMPFEDIFSPAVDIRFSISEELLLGLNIESLKKTATGSLRVGSQTGTKEIPIEDGFNVIPFEFFLHYIMPFSSEKFKFLIGGGIAYYFGEHVRKFGDESVSNVKRDFAYGIQVSISSDYMVTDFLSIRGEMKFRDPEYNVTSKYNKRDIKFNNETVRIFQEQFDSKINIDGVTFTLGAAIHF